MTPEFCPRCEAPLSEGQEYCISCGTRLPTERFSDRRQRGVGMPLALTFLVAAAASAVAIAATWDGTAEAPPIVATGGSLRPPEATATRDGLTHWPSGERGWTIVLASIPKERGKAQALAVAKRALDRGLEEVGVLDSSRMPSLHAGYWAVFAGVYPTEPEATSDLVQARLAARKAAVRRIVAGS